MSEDEKMSRRKFLRGVGLSSPLIIYGAIKAIRDGIIAPRRGDFMVNSPPLEATAVALQQKQERTSFQPEGEFTKEIFEAMQRGTVLLNTFYDHQSQENPAGKGTAWLARKEKDANGQDVYYFVTNRHVIEGRDGNRVSGVSAIRPGIDGEALFTEDINVVVAPDNADIALIKLRGKFPSGESSLEALAWEDDKRLNPGEKGLVVGFPKEFIASPDNDSLTLGSVVTADPPSSFDKSDVWSTHAHLNVGSSGSPLAIVRDGHPVVVSLHSFKYVPDIDILLNRKDAKPQVSFVPLSLATMMEEVDK